MDEFNKREAEKIATRRPWVAPEVREIELTTAKVGDAVGGGDTGETF